MSAPRLRIFGSTVAHIKRSGRGEAHTAEQVVFDVTSASGASITGSAPTDTNFSEDAVSFTLTVDGATVAVVLDADYETAEGVADAINAQAGSDVATVESGTLTIASGTTGADAVVAIDDYTEEGDASAGLEDGESVGEDEAMRTVADVLQELLDNA